MARPILTHDNRAKLLNLVHDWVMGITDVSLHYRLNSFYNACRDDGYLFGIESDKHEEIVPLSLNVWEPLDIRPLPR